MRRLGRYPLAVMAWIAVYAGWSSVLGLVIAAVTGERLEDGDRVGPTVGLGVSTLFTVVLPLVPTVVALWFNDWLRDGAPSRADRERARRAPQAPQPARPPDPEAAAPAAAGAGTVRASAEPPRPVATLQAPAGQGTSVRPTPLGVPEVVEPTGVAAGFPVAPLLRGAEEAPAHAVATPVPVGAAPAAPTPRLTTPRPRQPVIDPDDPLGVGDLCLGGLGGGEEPLGVQAGGAAGAGGRDGLPVGVVDDVAAGEDPGEAGPGAR